MTPPLPVPLSPDEEAHLRGLAETEVAKRIWSTLDAVREERDALREALSNLMDRIKSEPTMSGHLVGMRLMADHIPHHATSDAIRAAKHILSEPKHG